LRNVSSPLQCISVITSASLTVALFTYFCFFLTTAELGEKMRVLKCEQTTGTVSYEMTRVRLEAVNKSLLFCLGEKFRPRRGHGHHMIFLQSSHVMYDVCKVCVRR
jgi:hypothetical protein